MALTPQVDYVANSIERVIMAARDNPDPITQRRAALLMAEAICDAPGSVQVHDRLRDLVAQFEHEARVSAKAAA